MSRLSLFNSPLLLGFEEFERRVDRITKMQTEGYPPYNIEQTGKTSLELHWQLPVSAKMNCLFSWKTTSWSLAAIKMMVTRLFWLS